MSFSIVVATHGRFGEELVQSAQMIVGQMDQVHTLSLLPDKSFEDFMAEANQLLEGLKGPVLVLVDLFGGTPSNVLSVLTKKYGHHVFTGVNLPVLIELYLLSTSSVDANDFDLSEIKQKIEETYQASLVYTNERLPE